MDGFEKIEQAKYYTVVNSVKKDFETLPTLVLKNIHTSGDPSDIITIDDFTTTNSTKYINQLVSDEMVKYNAKTTMICSVHYEDAIRNISFDEDDCVEIKAQGDSSLTIMKHNWNIKFSSKHKLGGFSVKKKKWMLKSDYDKATHTHLNIWGNIWRNTFNEDFSYGGITYRTYDTLSTEIKNTPMMGAIKAYPIKVYFWDEVNDVKEYLGIYSLCNTKDDLMACFDEESNPMGTLLMKYMPDAATRGDIGDGVTMYGTVQANNFTANWNGIERLFDGGLQFEGGDKYYRAEKVRSFNKLSEFVRNSSDSEYKDEINSYIDITSVIDYLIIRTLIQDSDAYKNLVLWTTNANYNEITVTGKNGEVTVPADTWHLGFYDWDSWSWPTLTTWGDWSNNTNNNIYISVNEWNPGSLLFDRTLNIFVDEIKARYEQLKERVLNASVIVENAQQLYRDIAGLEIYDSRTANGIPRPLSTVTNKFTEAIDNSGFGGKLDMVKELYTALTNRIGLMDQLMENLDTWYPFYLIQSIDAKESVVTLDSSVTSINVYDYFTFNNPSIDNSIKTNTNVNKDILINVSGDMSLVTSSVTSGELTLGSGDGIFYVSLAANQYKNNSGVTNTRCWKTYGKCFSQMVKFVKGSLATTSEIKLLGNPFANEDVYVECEPNGLFDHIEWSMSNGKIVKTGTNTALASFVYDEAEYEIIAKVYTDATTYFETSYIFDSLLPEYTLALYSYGIKTNITNLKYDTLEIEGQFKIEYLSQIVSGNIAYGCIPIFGTVSTVTQKLSVSNWGVDSPTATIDGVGLYVMWRKFGRKTTYNVCAVFGNKIIGVTSSSDSAFPFIGSSCPSTIMDNCKIQLDPSKISYFKLNKNYLQINDVRYGWNVAYKVGNTATKQPLGIFGTIKNDGAFNNELIAGGSGYSRRRLYYLSIYENGVKTHHLVPTPGEDITATTVMTDVVSSTTTCGLSVNGFYKSYDVWPSPGIYKSYSGANNVSYISYMKRLPKLDGAVAFNGDNFIDLNVQPNYNYTYEIKFRTAYVPKSQTSVKDARGRLFGSRTGITTIGSSTLCVTLIAENGGTPTINTERNGTATCKQSVNGIDFLNTDITYRYEPTKLTITGSDGTLIENTFGKPGTMPTTGSLYLGAYTYQTNFDLLVSYNAFYGYIYYFKVSDENGNTVMDLQPNTHGTGFVDSVSGNEYLVNSGRCVTDTELAVPSITHFENDEFIGKKVQLECESSSTVYCQTRNDYMYYSSKALYQQECGTASGMSNKRVSPVWEIVDGSDYAEITADGLLTVYETADHCPITVCTYYECDDISDTLHDTYTFTLTYEN